MGRLSRALRHAARWASSWLLAGAVARRAAADARRQAKYSEACLRIARRRTQERDNLRRLLESKTRDHDQAVVERDNLKSENSRQRVQIENVVAWNQSLQAKIEANGRVEQARGVRATEQLNIEPE
jgi:hypothetical protein